MTKESLTRGRALNMRIDMSHMSSYYTFFRLSATDPADGCVTAPTSFPRQVATNEQVARVCIADIQPQQ